MLIKKWIGVCGVCATALYISACATVTIRPEGGERASSAPNYEERKTYFFWGLAGEHDIDVGEICKDKAAEQMQSQYTFADGFLGAITLGIYSPKTAKVWCK